MIACEVFRENDPIELLEGRLCIKLENGPPYEVPLGIPPDLIASTRVDRRPQRRFTVREYHKLMDSGAFHPELRTELVEGWVIDRMNGTPRHDSTLQRAGDALSACIGRDWGLRCKSALTLDDGECEPDIVVVRGRSDFYEKRHPRPCDVGLLIEISDTTLAYDSALKLRDYARNGVSRCLLVNLIDVHVESYEDPSGPTDQPGYRFRAVHTQDEPIPIVLRNGKMVVVRVGEMMRL
jgi:hypothetical protein